MFAMDLSEIGVRTRLVNLIVTEDDPDIRGKLAELLAFREVEVDELAPSSVGTEMLRILDGTSEMFDKEEIGTGIWRYSF